jgi:hypothetical protein
MSFPFDRLPPELRLEIWAFAVQSDAQRRLVIEQSFQVFPTLDLIASPLFSANTESREAAQSFYPVCLEVYRRTSFRPNPSLYYHPIPTTPTSTPTPTPTSTTPGNEPSPPQDDVAVASAARRQRRDVDYRGVVYLSPELDNIVSVHPRTQLCGLNDMNFFGNYDPELVFDRSERSKTTALRHRTAPMEEDTRRLFRRFPNRWCLLWHASKQLQVQDWVDVHDWMLAFGEDEYCSAVGLLRSMRINSWEFAQVFGW